MSASLLPLTALEEYFLWEDRPSYPCSIFARLRFSGSIERRALEEAVRAVMPRHPLLASRVEMRGRRPHWIVQPAAEPRIEWSAGPAGQAMPAARRQDLREEIGLKLLVVEDRDACDVTLQAHHACCDGAGLERVLNDLLIAYAFAAGMHSPRLRLPPLDPGRLARRGDIGSAAAKLAWLPGVARFISRSPAPLLPCRALPGDEAPPPGFPATHVHTFTREETAALRRAARRLGVMVNDVLARDVFLALGEWRGRHGAAADDAWLRLMVPMDLRTADDRRLPAANKLGAVFLDRRAGDLADPGRLLGGIADEMRRIGRHGLGAVFTHSLRLIGLVPGGLRAGARRDRCRMSGIFSNMGRMLQRCPLPRQDGRLVAGGLVLEQVDGVAPIRPYNCATFLATEYAGRLTMTLHYDSRPVAAKQANDLIGTFARRVRATASGGA